MRYVLTLSALVCLSIDLPAAEPAVTTVAPATTVPSIGEPRPQAYLGIAIDAAATAFEGHGLVVLRVEPGSPAAVMGIAGGDRLLRLDGQPLATREELQRLLDTRKPGDRIVIDALRVHGGDQKTEAFTCTGTVQELPRTRTSSLGTQLNDLQARLAELEKQAKEPTLAEILERLQRIEADLPKAAAAFKRIYPDGEFRIAISVEITSHKTAATPLAIEVGGRPADRAGAATTP
jgi:membrane-associated protease RseP (regulator of RpoE activity)